MQVSQEFFELLFLIMMGCAGILTFIGGPSWLLLSIFTPKKVLEEHFKEPHFTQGELIMMAGYPFFLMRTLIFSWALLVPSLDKKRKFVELKKNMPSWYAYSIQTYLVLVLFFGFLAFWLFGFLAFWHLASWPIYLLLILRLENQNVTRDLLVG